MDERPRELFAVATDKLDELTLVKIDRQADNGQLVRIGFLQLFEDEHIANAVLARAVEDLQINPLALKFLQVEIGATSLFEVDIREVGATAHTENLVLHIVDDFLVRGEAGALLYVVEDLKDVSLVKFLIIIELS